jgi:sialic acid synthase SpsE
MKLPSEMAANPAKPMLRYLLSKAEPVIASFGILSIKDGKSAIVHSNYSAVKNAMQAPLEPSALSTYM